MSISGLAAPEPEPTEEDLTPAPANDAVPLNAAEDASSETIASPSVGDDDPKVTTEESVSANPSSTVLATNDPDPSPTSTVESSPETSSNDKTDSKDSVTVVEEPKDAILEALMAKMSPLGQSEDTFLKILIYGDPGTWKTSFAASAENCLVYNQEKGTIGALGSPNKTKGRIQEIAWTSFRQAEMLVDRLNKSVPAFDWIETLAVDTFSDMHKRAMREIADREWANNPTTVNRYKVDDYHQENNERISTFARELRDLNRNLILLAHERTNEKTGKVYPDFSESLANKIEAQMDIVGRMTLEEDENGNEVACLTVKAQTGVHCKTRITTLPKVIINPTFPQILAVYEQFKRDHAST